MKGRTIGILGFFVAVLFAGMVFGSSADVEGVMEVFEKVDAGYVYTIPLQIDGTATYGEIIITGDYENECIISATVNENKCKPEEYKIPSKSIRYPSKFVCPLEKENKVSFYASCRASNVIVEHKAVVEEKVKFIPTITVKGTEYYAGDEGKTIVLLTDDKGNPILNATCMLKVYYPNETIFIYNAPMKLLGTSGLYTYDFVVPDALGVYPELVKCTYAYDFKYYNASSGTVVVGDETGTYVNTFLRDGVVHRIDEKGKTFDVRYNFTGIALTGNITELSIFSVYRWDRKNDPVRIHLWNFANNRWELVASCGFADVYADCGVVITEDFSKYVSGGRAWIKINDSNKLEADGVYRLDYLNLRIANASYFIADLYGTGEIHVNNKTALSVHEIWNYENRTLTMNISCNGTIGRCTCICPNITNMSCGYENYTYVEKDRIGTEANVYILPVDKITLVVFAVVLMTIVISLLGLFR